MPHFVREGARLFYQRHGTGDPPLVFVHGYCCSHQDWECQVQAFAHRHVVVACDLRGHGRSQGDPQRCSIEALGADVRGLVASLAARPTILVGHSMGCRVILQAYLDAPEWIAGLVLIDGSWVSPSDLPVATEVARERLESQGYAAFVRNEFEGMFPLRADQGLKERIMAQALATPEAIGRPLFMRAIEWDARHMEAALGRVTVPLLILQSTAVSRERRRSSLETGGTTPWLDLVRRLVPAARIRILAGLGHFSMLEAPDTVNQEIASFAESLNLSPR